MPPSVRGFIADNSGVTFIEYGLIGVLISVAFLTVVGSIGTNLGTVFTSVATKV